MSLPLGELLWSYAVEYGVLLVHLVFLKDALSNNTQIVSHNRYTKAEIEMLIVDYDLKNLMMWYLWCEFCGSRMCEVC